MRTFRLLAVLLGVTAFLLGLRIFGRSYSMTRWPVTPARVIASSLVTTPDGRYVPRVDYEFILAGRRYPGSGIRTPAGAYADSTADPMETRAAAESVVARYPPGREMPAGYDPENPARSVLEPALTWWPLGLAIAGAVAIGAGVLAGRRRG